MHGGDPWGPGDGLGDWQAEEFGGAGQQDGKDQVRGGKEMRQPGKGSLDTETPRIMTWMLKSPGRQGITGVTGC